MIENLHVFRVAAASRSLSEAARQLGLPSSSVSRRISALEQHIGTALFVRTTRHLELTEAGRVYLASVQRALAELRQGENAVHDMGNAVRGTLVVDARVLLGARLVVPLLPELRRRYPNLSVDLRSSHSLSPDLTDGVDVGVRYEIGPDSHLIARRFATSRCVLVASPHYLERHGTPAHPDELEAHQCIRYYTDGSEGFWRMRGPGYEGILERHGQLVSNNVFSLIQAAVEGLGLYVAHEWSVVEELRSGRLVRIMEDYEVGLPAGFEIPLYVTYNPHLRDTGKVRAFVDCMVEHYADGMQSLS
jgi:DNA-binding transcriptional LysR family regulator